MAEHLGTFPGHIIPGTMFILAGLWWFRTAGQGGTPLTSRREALVVSSAAIGGAVGELWWASWLMTDTSVINYQHATMYLGFAAVALLYLLARRGMVSTRLPLLALGGAFAATAMLFGVHGSHMAVSGSIHTLLAGLLLACAVVAALEAVRPSLALTIARAWLTCCVGTWFWQAAWMLYRSDYNLGSASVVMRVHLFFIWHLMGVGLLLVAAHVLEQSRVRITSTSLRRRTSGA